jgi:hypothetical protein
MKEILICVSPTKPHLLKQSRIIRLRLARAAASFLSEKQDRYIVCNNLNPIQQIQKADLNLKLCDK